MTDSHDRRTNGASSLIRSAPSDGQQCFDRTISDWLRRLGASPVTPGTTRLCELHPIKRRMLAATGPFWFATDFARLLWLKLVSLAICDFYVAAWGRLGDRPICPSSVKEIRGGAEGGGRQEFLSIDVAIISSRSMDSKGCVHWWCFDKSKPRTSSLSSMNTETRATSCTNHSTTPSLSSIAMPPPTLLNVKRSHCTVLRYNGTPALAKKRPMVGRILELGQTHVKVLTHRASTPNLLLRICHLWEAYDSLRANSDHSSIPVWLIHKRKS